MADCRSRCSDIAPYTERSVTSGRSEMPNLLNIAELTRLLESAPKDSDHVHTLEELQAHFLAANGVLAPAALTDDEAVKIGADAVGNLPTEPAEVALCVREGLERIARGA